MNPLLTKAYNAEAAVAANTIVMAGSADDQVVHATAETDGLLGVAGALGADADDRIDVIMVGIAEVKTGGIIARGELVTSDASGYGVKLTSTMLQGGACNSIGIALKAAASGDIIPILVSPQLVSQFDAVTASAAEINVLDGIAGGLTAAELSILDGVTATAAELNTLDGGPQAATIVVGVEGSHAINVAIQLKDANGADIAVRGAVRAYLSDDANGDSIIATAHDGHVVIGTDGVCVHLVTDKMFELVSEADGDIDITITEAGAKNSYLIVILPNGKLVASTIIAHAG
jgi:hypothetical protein